LIKSNKIEGKSIRVFFAIFPNKQVQKQLIQHSKMLESIYGGHKIKMQHLHMTLLFLGNISIPQIETLRKIAQTISAKKFALKLDVIGYWKHNHIIYIRAKESPAELFSLTDSLKIALSENDFVFDNRTYKPHITILRKAICHINANLIEPIQWHVNQWFLIQSQPTCNGIEYIPLNHWYLK
jgi:2'-5' RNA ligase